MNTVSFTSLCKKEVISLSDGKKYGCPKDIEIDCSCGRPVSLVMPCRMAFAFFTGSNTYTIPWCDIERIGEDVIWICKKVKDDCCEQNNKRSGKCC